MPWAPAAPDASASASAQGLMVQYPNSAGDVPRYEARVAVPQGALTSLRPFPL